VIGISRHVVVTGAYAAVVLASCGIIGDRSQPIDFVNRSGQTILLYERGRAYPVLRKDLVPEARLRSAWIDSHLDDRGKDVIKFRVEATSDAGDLIFCHDFTWNDFIRAGWVVEIRAQNDCPPS